LLRTKKLVSIPLTFDWTTLTWLKLRVSLWLRRRRVLPARALVGLLALTAFAGCVPVTRYEQAESAAQLELTGRKRAEQQLAELKTQNAALSARAQEQGAAIDQREQALAQAELDKTTQGKERADADGLVEQLRGELARVGSHLQSYHDDKQKLELSRDAEMARGRELSRLSRDLALALSAPITTGDYTLDAEQSGLVLRVPRDQLLAADGSVKAEAQPLLKALSLVLALHESSKLRIEDGAPQVDSIAVARVVAALGERGVAAERFEPLAKAPAAAGTASDALAAPPVGPAETTFAFSVP
jgi:hypothetical protein